MPPRISSSGRRRSIARLPLQTCSRFRMRSRRRSLRGSPVEPMFRAISDPMFNERDRQQVLAVIDKKDKADFTLYALWLLRGYEDLADASSDSPTVMWATDDPQWLRSPARKRMMQRWRLPEYW